MTRAARVTPGSGRGAVRRTLLLGVACALALGGCRGGTPRPPASSPAAPVPSVPSTAVPPADAPEFWARLRAVLPAFDTTPSPGQVAAADAQAAACRELNVLGAAAQSRRAAFRLDNGDRTVVRMAAARCADGTAEGYRSAAGVLRAVLRHDPFATPTP